MEALPSAHSDVSPAVSKQSRSLRVEGEEHDHTLRAGQKRKVLYAVAFPLLVYTYVLLPTSVLEMLLYASGSIAKILAYGGAGVGAAVLFGFVFYAQHPLRHGKTRVAEFFQSQYPTSGNAEQLRCAQREIDAAWFDFLHLMAHPASGLQSRVRDNYETTYAALAIYYLQRLLPLFAVLGVATMLVNHWYLDGYTAEHGRALLVLHGAAVLAYGFVGTWLVASNRFDRDGHPSGCWRRVSQEFGMQRSEWERIALAGATSIAEVRANIDAWERSLTSPKVAS